MLESSLRLKKRKTFNYIYRHGKSVGNKHLTIFFLPMKSKNLKIGFSVSGKVGNAVVRNRVRRRLRAAMNTYIGNMLTNFNIIVVAKPGADEANYDIIISSLGDVLKKAGILRY